MSNCIHTALDMKLQLAWNTHLERWKIILTPRLVRLALNGNALFGY